MPVNLAIKKEEAPVGYLENYFEFLLNQFNEFSLK